MKVLTPETAIHKEQRLFKELSARLIDTLLNRMFDLRPKNASRRSIYFFILFLFNGFVITLIYYPPSAWVEQFSNTSTELLTFISTVITDPRILRFLSVFFAPFIIALHSAAVYLSDVFELGDVSVARHFIRGVALSGSNETIRIKNGEIADEHRDSPVFLIGGPGKVVVDLDSAALFEKADGTPHLIGPTGKEQGGKATLDGFERLRHTLDIRDHYITLRDQDDKSTAVKSRSLDGIPIKATDVRLMFSIFRGDKPETSPENPYPFSREALERIVYKAASRVTPELSNPSAFEFSWTNNMVGLIRSRLGGFMGQHKLSEYLASIGMPEAKSANEREDKIVEERQELTHSKDGVSEKKEITPPEFKARYVIKNLFAQFAEEFTGKARNSGVELHWIGVGTWESPVKDVPEDHLQAWILTQENLKKDKKMDKVEVEKEEVVKKMKELIKKIPINTYHQIIDPTYIPDGFHSPDNHDGESNEEMIRYRLRLLQNRDQSDDIKHEHKETDHNTELKTLLNAYRNLLIETADIIKEKKEQVPQNILDAIKIIENQFPAHWVGKTEPKTNSDRSETELYAVLVNMVSGDKSTADRLIEFELRQFPNETRIQLIQRAIDRLIRDKN